MAARPVPLTVGEPAPWFFCRTQRRQRFAFDTIAGRYIVLSFFGSVAAPLGAAVLETVKAHRGRFDDRAGAFRPITYVLDPALRVLAVIPFARDAGAHAKALHAVLNTLPEIGAAGPALAQAPVLVVPGVFEPDFCRGLVNYYETHGGEESGFMRDVDGKTVALLDPQHKRRKDRVIEDEALSGACLLRIRERLVPEIRKAFQFAATRMERHIVSCYDAEEGGHFRAHRDNTTRGTAHRRFAVSLFLNSGEYEGGFLRFPEFGSSLHAAPAGGAVVFSCSFLHEATRVTRGRRYMFLPFLYDDTAARLRQENLRYVDASAAITLRRTAA